MDKGELIHIHMLLVQIKNYFEKLGIGEGFPKYDSLGVKPTHVHKNKKLHKKAIFILGEELAAILSEDKYSNAALSASKLAKIAERVTG